MSSQFASLSRANGDKLFRYFHSSFPEETEKAVNSLGLRLADLFSRRPDGDATRFSHHEDRRLTLIIKVIEALVPLIRTKTSASQLTKLLRSLGIQQKSSARRLNRSAELRQCTSVQYSRPKDVMKAELNREKHKFDHGKEVLKRLNELKDQASHWS